MYAKGEQMKNDKVDAYKLFITAMLQRKEVIKAKATIKSAVPLVSQKLKPNVSIPKDK